MIDWPAATRAVEAGSVDRLVAALGYPVDPVGIDPHEWARCGIDLALDPGVTLRRLVAVGHIEMFALETDGGAGDLPPRVIELLSNINRIIKYVIFHVDLSERKISIHSTVDRGARRRLDLGRGPLAGDVRDRLALLEFRGDDGPAQIEARIDAALDRDRITTEFFRRFRQATREFADAMRARSSGVLDDEIEDEALVVMSRLLFLRFVQEKAWLDGDRGYLLNRFTEADRRGRSFFDDDLRTLFFGCLNTPWPRRRSKARDLGAIPYLNGGLFEPTSLERRRRRFGVPNELVGRAIDEVFERFPFSLSEDDGAGIHIDPEMLGKVFESLMESGERARSGSFYTPREIVGVVAGRAIAEAVAGGDATLAESIGSIEEGAASSLGATRAREVLARLRDLTILDPACGSGAFLLAALDVMERIERAILPELGEPVPWSLRRRIVERNLYGVDLKGAAVRLCELRLWLAIVSDPSEPRTRDVRDIRPLPNLDRNVLQGDSLLGPLDFLGGERLGIYSDWARGLKRRAALVERYRTAARETRPELNRALRRSDRALAEALLRRAIERDREEIESIEAGTETMFGRIGTSSAARERVESRIARNGARLASLDRGDLGFFAYEVHFANVLDRGGFDVVLGNPPWVRRSRVEPETRRLLADRYRTFGHGGGFDQSDLSIAFVERSIALTREGGVVAMVVPGKIASAFYASRLRETIATSHELIAVDDWRSEGRALFGADVFPIAVTVRRARPSKPRAVRLRGVDGVHAVDPRELAETPSGPWCLAPPPVAAILRRLTRSCGSLEEVLGRAPVMGMKTGANGSFFLGELAFSETGIAIDRNSGERIPREALARCVRGRDVRRWKSEASTWMIWPPAASRSRLAAWAGRRGVPEEALRLAWVRPEHLGIKVVWKDLSRGVQAVVLPETVDVAGGAVPLIPNQTLYVIDAASMDEAYLLSAVLNSTPIDGLAIAVADPAKDAHYRYYGKRMASLPWPPIAGGSPRALRLIRLARKAHQGVDVGEEIDREVADAFGLSESERSIIREFVTWRLGRN